MDWKLATLQPSCATKQNHRVCRANLKTTLWFLAGTSSFKKIKAHAKDYQSNTTLWSIIMLVVPMKYFDAQHRTRAERVGPFNLWLGTDRVVKNISGRIEYGPGKDISNNNKLPVGLQ